MKKRVSGGDKKAGELFVLLLLGYAFFD